MLVTKQRCGFVSIRWKSDISLNIICVPQLKSFSGLNHTSVNKWQNKNFGVNYPFKKHNVWLNIIVEGSYEYTKTQVVKGAIQGSSTALFLGSHENHRDTTSKQINKTNSMTDSADHLQMGNMSTSNNKS